MKKNLLRRSFLVNTLKGTAGLALLSSTSTLHAFALGDNSPFEGYNPYAREMTDLRTLPFGEHIHVKGKVFAKDGKAPLKNALVEVWHLSPNSKKYRHQAKFKTNAAGDYAFITDRPSREYGKYRKIYFKVSRHGASYFTELSFNDSQAFISGRHWEENRVLPEEHLFPKKSKFQNISTIQFNLTFNHI